MSLIEGYKMCPRMAFFRKKITNPNGISKIVINLAMSLGLLEYEKYLILTAIKTGKEDKLNTLPIEKIREKLAELEKARIITKRI